MAESAHQRAVLLHYRWSHSQTVVLWLMLPDFLRHHYLRAQVEGTVRGFQLVRPHFYNKAWSQNESDFEDTLTSGYFFWLF